MRTLNYLSKVGSLVLLSSGLASIANAQLTQNPDGLWLETDAGLATTGTTVNSWTDQTANGFVLTPTGTSPTTATDLPSNSTVIQFSGNNELSLGGVAASAISGGTTGTIFIVAKIGTPGSGGQTVFGWQGGGLVGAQDYNVNGNGPEIINGHGNLGASDFVSALPPSGFYDNWHILTIQRNGSSGLIQVDGSSQTLSVNNTFQSTGTTGLGTGTLGVGSDTFSGEVAAVLVYKGALDGTQISNVEGYLQTKYFTAVPEPSQYAMVFSLVCVAGAIGLRIRRSSVARAL